jgi:predicted GIY-YIG superfamily endonuclease
MPAHAGIHDFCPAPEALATKKGGWVYIVTHRPNGVLYTRVTNDLDRTISENRAEEIDGLARN